MSENVYLILKSNDKPVQGESSRHSLDRANTIECRQIHMGARTGTDRAGKGVGAVLFDDFVVIKPIDCSSPLIYQGLCKNERIELEAKFFRPSQDDGHAEHFYSILGEGGRITSISQSTPDGNDASSASEEPCETICFKFEKITFKYPTKNLEYTHSRKDSE